MSLVHVQTGEVIQLSQWLDRLTQGERMLVSIATTQDALDVIDFAEAARVYAKEMRLGTSAVNHSTVIKLRAERRLADMVDAGQKAGVIAVVDKKGLPRSPGQSLKSLGVKDQRLTEARRIRDTYTDEQLIEAAEEATARDRELARNKLLKAAAAKETRARREASRVARVIPDAMDLRIGDAREVLADMPDASVALVLTDPPYGDEAAPLYAWLGQWAARVLVPGGSLICYTGQSRLDRDMRLLGEHLRYWWLLAMLHHQSQRLPGKFVIAEFKPVLWYVKEKRRGRTLVNDLLRSPARDKTDHNWAQGEGGVHLLIEQLTDPGELVADPFAGSARWGEITTSMGRRWVGADIGDGGEGAVVA